MPRATVNGVSLYHEVTGRDAGRLHEVGDVADHHVPADRLFEHVVNEGVNVMD